MVDHRRRQMLGAASRSVATTDSASTGASGGGGVPSQVWATGAAPLSAGTVDNETYDTSYSPNDRVLTAFETDVDEVVVDLEIHVNSDDWQPAWVRVTPPGSGAPVKVQAADWTHVQGRDFTAQATVTIDASGTLTVDLEDGDQITVDVTRALDPPEVTAATFQTHPTNTGGSTWAPADQTHVHSLDDSLNDPDSVYISGTTDAHATHVYVKAGGVSGALQGPYAVTAGVFSNIEVEVGATGSGLTATLYAVAGLGSTAGPDFATTNTVDSDNTLPTFGSASVAYPVGQEALKDTESADVTLSCTNRDTSDTVLYDDNSTGQLTIGSTTTYASPKTVSRASGNYNESSTNFRLTVVRAGRNGTIARGTAVVRIAHVAPTVTVARNTVGAALLRLGTDDGTNGFRDHSIYVVSDQARLSTTTFTITADASCTAAFTGAATQLTPTASRRTYRVEDGDFVSGGQAANTYTWASVSVTNRANKTTTTIANNPTYELGGFDERELVVTAWPNRTVDIGCLVVDTSKLVCENTSDGGPGPNGGTYYTFDNSPGAGGTPDNEADKFCIVNGSDQVDDDNQHWYNKDQANAQSNAAGGDGAVILLRETA